MSGYGRYSMCAYTCVRTHPHPPWGATVPPFRLRSLGREIILLFHNPDSKKWNNQLIDLEERIHFLITEKGERHNYFVFPNYLLSVCDAFESLRNRIFNFNL